MSELQVQHLSHDEARNLTDEIRDDAERLWAKLLEAYEGGAHLALGYSSWGVYFEAEFSALGKKSRGYQLLEAARVIRELDSVHTCGLNEGQARELVPLLGNPEELRMVMQQAEESGAPITATLLRDAVDVVTQRPHVSNNSGENEWYTPEPYIVAARDVMGSLTLDPASSEVANEAIGADTFFTSTVNGLHHEWHGTIWLNPPYAQPLIGQFAAKLVEEWNAEHVKQACVLVNNATETAWFQALAAEAHAICFPSQRVRFWQPGGSVGQPLQGQSVFYFGPGVERFRHRFAEFGFTVEL